MTSIVRCGNKQLLRNYDLWRLNTLIFKHSEIHSNANKCSSTNITKEEEQRARFLQSILNVRSFISVYCELLYEAGIITLALQFEEVEIQKSNFTKITEIDYIQTIVCYFQRAPPYKKGTQSYPCDSRLAMCLV